MIQSLADLEQHIQKLVACGPAAIGRVMLCRACQRREIALQEVSAGGSVGLIKHFIRAVRDRPSILLIGDDDGIDRGPAGFLGAQRAITWGRWFLVHAAGGEPDHYAAAILAAKAYRRVVVIECSSLTLPEWEPLARLAPNHVGGIVVRPRGGVHPVREALA
jgi:hypothetical protein